LRFWRLGDLALIGDESYFWLWSRHLDWAYFDHPAGVAILIRLSTALGGGSEAGIRWLNALLGLACVLLTYVLGKRLFSRRAGLFAALVVAIGAPYLLTSRFVYTDALQLALLLLNLLLFWNMAQEQPRPRLPAAVAWGLTLGLLFNTKYSAYLYALALGVVILVDYRHLVKDPRFWLGVGVAALGLLPVVTWNALHGWASFRWQLQHAGLRMSAESSLLGSAQHAVAYLTWPLMLLALLGLGQVRGPAGRLLGVPALVLLLPVALSAANSPRNLSSGLVLLAILAGGMWASASRSRGRIWLAALMATLVGAAAVHGLGSVVNLRGPSPLPESSIVSAIRRDAAGWRELGPRLAASPYPTFALDYSIASQAWYYGGRPAYTSWGQYRIWGIPALRDLTVVSLDYLPADLVTDRLRSAFREVEGPQEEQFEEWSAVKVVRTWQAEALLADNGDFLDQFDFLTLLESAR
jgi:4-amino-4-deoxy-L-arabinose transferase-like glycosyltransferase